MKMYGIEYIKPEVILLQESGIGVAEIAARTCYDSFENSENKCVKNFSPDNIGYISELEELESSKLLESLAWVHHHHSIIEHSSLSFLVKGTSRGVLQEHARHRLQNISVKSTRYTMAGVINAFIASLVDLKFSGIPTAKNRFNRLLQNFDMFVVLDKAYIKSEIDCMWDKLYFQYNTLGVKKFHNIAIAKSSFEYLNTNLKTDELFQKLQEGKKKRNVGDGFKHIVSDNWKVDMVVTFNLRSLKNYFDLRDSGAAWFQIQWLAQAMKEVTPKKYLKLIDKKFKV